MDGMGPGHFCRRDLPSLSGFACEPQTCSLKVYVTLAGVLDFFERRTEPNVRRARKRPDGWFSWFNSIPTEDQGNSRAKLTIEL